MRPLLASLALLALLAGCAGPAPSDPATASDLPATDPTQLPPAPTEVYRHDALVVGVGLPNPVDPLGAPWPVPPSKVESFQLDLIAHLSFAAEVCSGTGLAGFEVAGPDGTVVWGSEVKKRADTPGVGCVQLPALVTTDGPFPPGQYEVRVLVGGAMQPVLTVEATPAVVAGQP